MLEITAVRTIPLRAPLDRPFWSATHVGLDPKLGMHATRGMLLVEVEAAEGLVEQGFRSVKMKIGYLSIEDDFERIRLVRATLPKGYGLMVDANRSYTPKTALRVARRLADLDILFFEEPTNPDDLEGAAAVGAGSPVPIAGYETEYTRVGYRELILRRAVDIVQPNVTWCGGISEGKKIGRLAAAFHLGCVPHTFGSSLTLIANLHLGASLPNAIAVEFDPTVNPLM